MALERLSCHKDFKIIQAQTKVSFYLNPLLQVEFRVVFEPFSYILLNGSNVTQYCHVCKSQTTSGPPVIPVVRKLDNAIHWINHCPVDSVVCFVNTYPLDSDLSGG